MPPRLKKSPLAPRAFPALPPIEGVALSARACGLHYRGRPDLLLAEFAPATRAAGVFTQAAITSPAVDLSRRHLKESGGRAAALVVHAGNANAFTGAAGARLTERIAAHTARRLKRPVARVLTAATGVIGVLPDSVPILGGIDKASPADWKTAARAIGTTDTFPKGAARTARFGSGRVKINVIAKGSGMIAPNMATMLAFVFTDAALPVRVMQKLLREAVARSFNCITVDGDSSTSDSCFLFATGAKPLGGAPLARADDRRLKPFRDALDDALRDAAIQVVSDGEGISRLMTIDVVGAASDEDARRIGLAVGNSPLVKTAVAGGDANWGRIVMAVGKSGGRVMRDRLGLDIGGHKVARNGKRVAGFKEAPIARHMRGKRVHFVIRVNLPRGRGKARVWASDLTHGYISINADYRS